jgi:hypothetical protein
MNSRLGGLLAAGDIQKRLAELVVGDNARAKLLILAVAMLILAAVRGRHEESIEAYHVIDFMSGLSSSGPHPSAQS